MRGRRAPVDDLRAPRYDDPVLERFEALLVDGLKTEITEAVFGGPPGTKDGRSDPFVEVFVASIVTAEPPDGERRRPAHRMRRVEFAADGEGATFVLPDDADGEVVAVEAPPGRRVERGDAYEVEGGELRFYRAPEAGDPGVAALVRGSRARGGETQRPAEIDARLAAWSKDAAGADALLTKALSGTLLVLERLRGNDVVVVESEKVGIRLLNLRSRVTGSTRAAEEPWFRAQATLGVQAELEIRVALGEPEPEGIIEAVEHKLLRP